MVHSHEHDSPRYLSTHPTRQLIQTFNITRTAHILAINTPTAVPSGHAV
jgi:hypothetical protein